MLCTFNLCKFFVEWVIWRNSFWDTKHSKTEQSSDRMKWTKKKKFKQNVLCLLFYIHKYIFFVCVIEWISFGFCFVYQFPMNFKSKIAIEFFAYQIVVCIWLLPFFCFSRFCFFANFVFFFLSFWSIKMQVRNWILTWRYFFFLVALKRMLIMGQGKRSLNNPSRFVCLLKDCGIGPTNAKYLHKN